VLGLLVVLVVAATGCSRDGADPGEDEAATVSTSSSTTAPPLVAPALTVVAKEYGFDIQPQIEGGVFRLTLQNDGRFEHEAVIVSVGDTPLDQVKRDLTPIVEGAGKATPAYLRFQGGVSLVAPGTSWAGHVSLPVGNYVMVCTLTDAESLDDTAGPPESAERVHYDLGMAASFTVKKTNSLPMPPTDGGTLLARDWSFEVPPLAPGIRTVLFRNDGQQDHSLAVAEFPDKIDAAAAKAAFETLLAAAPGKPLPDTLPTPRDVASSGPLSAGGQVAFAVHLKVNRTYVFACYMSDRPGGPLHATGKGMVAYATTPPG
jgi:hypothetical protein